MNRIYQGRVTRVEIPDGKGGWQLLGFKPDEAEQLEKERERLRLLTKKNDAKGKEARKQLAEINHKLNEPWQTALWKHHALFQDTVNYYLSAFAAMIDERTASDGLREFREAVIRSWESEIHSDGSWQMRVLGSTLSKQPAWKVFEKRIFSMTGSKATAAQRAAAIEAVFSDPTKVADDMEDNRNLFGALLRNSGRQITRQRSCSFSEIETSLWTSHRNNARQCEICAGETCPPRSQARRTQRQAHMERCLRIQNQHRKTPVDARTSH